MSTLQYIVQYKLPKYGYAHQRVDRIPAYELLPVMVNELQRVLFYSSRARFILF